MAADINWGDTGVGALVGAFAAWFAKQVIGEDVQRRLASLEAGQAEMRAQLHAMQRSLDRLLDREG